jgi:hypothetical protein
LLHQHVFITLDSDFSDKRNYPPSQAFGVVWLQTPREGRTLEELYQRVLTTMTEFDATSIRGKFIVLDSDKARVR